MKESLSFGVALVTGAGQRVGAVLAERLATAGYAVIVHYNGSSDAAQALVGRIAAAGGRAAAIRADLTARAERATLVAEAAGRFGPLTLLVNNASAYEPDSLASLDETLWDRHFALHAEAPLFLIRDFAAQLPKTAEGNVINIVDARVLTPAPAYLSYALSKAALHAATIPLAQSLAPRIRVNAIGPGPTLPERGQSRAAFEERNRRLPLGRGADPHAIADALLYLLGARSVTGQMISVDGGIHIEPPAWGGPTPRRDD